MGLIGGVLQPSTAGSRSHLCRQWIFYKAFRWLQAIPLNYYQRGPNFHDLCVSKIKPEQLASLDLSSWEVALPELSPYVPRRWINQLLSPVASEEAFHLLRDG